MTSDASTPRQFHQGDPFRPIYAVWELTLRCDHACAHCGSRAVRPRPDELGTDELLAVADGLARLGTREVTLIGGEAYLHPSFLTVVAHLANLGIRVTMQTGGRGLTPALAAACKRAGIAAIGVSIDGPEAAHDTLRASPGSHKAAVAALRNAREAGLPITSNCQVNRLNAHLLRETVEELVAVGIAGWRAQLTTPMGRAADHPEWILQPWEVIEVIDTLAVLQKEQIEAARLAGLPPERIVDIQIGNNLGYFGPHEALLRSRPGHQVEWYAGCMAGRHLLGIESDGTVKGCPSLPTAPYAGGNVRDLTLEAIWEAPEVAFARASRVDELWGFCKGCDYASVCQAGCSFHTTSTFGRRGNNPFCYHRARILRGRGLRERIVQVERAPGAPYDFGRFEISEEPWPGASGTMGPSRSAP